VPERLWTYNWSLAMCEVRVIRSCRGRAGSFYSAAMSWTGTVNFLLPDWKGLLGSFLSWSPICVRATRRNICNRSILPVVYI